MLQVDLIQAKNKQPEQQETVETHNYVQQAAELPGDSLGAQQGPRLLPVRCPTPDAPLGIAHE